MARELQMLSGVAVHTLVIYACLVVSLATFGRQQMGQLTLLDYLVVALLGSAVETGLYLGGGSFWAGIASAAFLLAANRAFRLLAQRYPRVRRFVAGTPVLVVHDGRIIRASLARTHLTEQDLLTAIRIRGYDGIEGLRYAVVEANGTVSAVPAGDRPSAGRGSSGGQA